MPAGESAEMTTATDNQREGRFMRAILTKSDERNAPS